jgi:serine protease AprX
MSADPFTPRPVIVEMKHSIPPFGALPQVVRAQAALTLLSLHGDPVGALPLIGGASGYATPLAIQAISLVPGVARVHEDRTVAPAPNPATPPQWPAGSVDSQYPKVVKANQVWPYSQAAGVTVAVLDSGIAPDPDFGSRLLASVNFAGTTASADAGGHGSHVAGIIAGNGTRSNGQYKGIAPAANLVSVRVLNDEGYGRLSSFIRGIEWAIAHRQQYNIRVMNLSLGAQALPSHRGDPLAAAVELAWKSGIVVVAASGNNGPQSNTVHSPGIDPYVITVGASDDMGTLALGNDLLGWFSSWGTQPGGQAKPDLVAPGRKLTSVYVPGSVLAGLYPERVVTASNGAHYFRLSGTSQATGVVSGAAALILARQPSLTPDQVKKILVSRTQPYGAGGTPPLPNGTADGAGLLNAKAAYDSPPLGEANQGALVPADAFARTAYPLLHGKPLVWRNPSYHGIVWSLLTWATLTWNSLTWENLAWDNIAYDNIAYDNIAYDNIAYDNIAYDNIAYDNIAYDNIAYD